MSHTVCNAVTATVTPAVTNGERISSRPDQTRFTTTQVCGVSGPASIDVAVGAVDGDFTHAVWRWNPWRSPSIVHISLGSDRYVEHSDPLPARRPVGFAPPARLVEPLLWEGDNG